MGAFDPFIEHHAGFVPELFDPAAVPRHIPKLVLIDRLHAAGLFDAALAALTADPLTYERWQASTSVDPADAEMRALLAAIGGDVDALLGTD